MKSIFKFLICACSIGLLLSFCLPFTWSSLSNDQLVNGSNLQDAIDNNVFFLKPGQSITKTSKVVLRSEANTWLEIVPLTNDNRGVRKGELVAAGPISCGTTTNFPAEPRTFTWEKNVLVGNTSGVVRFFFNVSDFDYFKIEVQYEGGAWETIYLTDDRTTDPYYTINLQDNGYYSFVYNTSNLIRVRITKNGSYIRPTSAAGWLIIYCPV